MMEQEMDRRFRPQVVNQTVIYCSVYVLTFSHELWVVTKKDKLMDTRTQNELVSLRDGGR